MRTRHKPRHTVSWPRPTGRNTSIRRSLGNGRCTANFLATARNLILPLLSKKDFVQVAGRALFEEALRPGKGNARAATHLHTRLLGSMRIWETKIRFSGGSTPLIRSATHISCT